MTPTAGPVVLDRLVALIVAVGASLSPALALAAIIVGGALVLAASDDAAIRGLARQAVGAVAGGLSALAVAHGLSALVGLALTGA
jgi:hypothetical protein